jgi:Bcr/CflA subfamily drug resistance transporter
MLLVINNSLKPKLIVLLVILLMTIGQLAVTLYLPSMPHMASDFATSDSMIQMTITVYVLGFGLSGFIYGPLSERHGRRLMVLIGLWIFVLGSSLALFAHSIKLLLLARFIQGIGIGSGDTMGRAILCDIFSGTQFVRAASYIGMAAPAVPIIAPVIGGYLQIWFNWRATFVLMLVYAVISLGLVYRNLPETRPSQTPHLPFIKVAGQYVAILKSRVFLGYFIPGVIAALGDLVYCMAAPFIIQEQFGWSPVQYGWVAILSACGIFIGALISNHYSQRLSTCWMVLAGLGLLLVSGLFLLLCASLGIHSVWPLVMAMFIFMASTGIIFPNTNAGALMPFAHAAGVVGALQGGLQTALTGSLGMLVAASSADQSLMRVAIIIIFIAGIGLGSVLTLLRKCR